MAALAREPATWAIHGRAPNPDASWFGCVLSPDLLSFSAPTSSPEATSYVVAASEEGKHVPRCLDLNLYLCISLPFEEGEPAGQCRSMLPLQPGPLQGIDARDFPEDSLVLCCPGCGPWIHYDACLWNPEDFPISTAATVPIMVEDSSNASPPAAVVAPKNRETAQV